MVLYLGLLFCFVGLLEAQMTSYTIPEQPGSPLYEYVHKDDGMFSFVQLDAYVQQGFTTYVFNMTSQQWFDDSWATPSVWYHYVTVHIPDTPDPTYYNNGFLYVSSSSWDSGVPDPTSKHVWETGRYTNRTGMVTGVIKQVPFQPIVFNGTIMERSEDAIIAWTWSKFLESGATLPPETLVRFPMCKAVSKAMDLMTRVAANKTEGLINLERFMIAGSSKRGWTSWLMPAADERVVAIAPIVLTCLNVNTNLHHYWRSLGNWTVAFIDYWVERIPEWLDHPDFEKLLDLVDPYYYRDVLTVPKLIISGSKDEFFMPDDYDYFFKDLLGEKYIWILENTGHSVKDGPLYDEMWEVLESFYIAVIKDRPRPMFTWNKGFDTTTGVGYIQVTTGEPVQSVEAWMADTPSVVSPRRDFRNIMLGEGFEDVETGIVYNLYNATDMGGNTWRVEFNKPETGYRAFFLKLTFPYPEEGRSFTFTTASQVLSFDPEAYFPFEDCTLKDCQGFLV